MDAAVGQLRRYDLLISSPSAHIARWRYCRLGEFISSVVLSS
jgi:hypothetical protein